MECKTSHIDYCEFEAIKRKRQVTFLSKSLRRITARLSKIIIVGAEDMSKIK